MLLKANKVLTIFSVKIFSKVISFSKVLSFLGPNTVGYSSPFVCFQDPNLYLDLCLSFQSPLAAYLQLSYSWQVWVHTVRFISMFPFKRSFSSSKNWQANRSAFLALHFHILEYLNPLYHAMRRRMVTRMNSGFLLFCCEKLPRSSQAGKINLACDCLPRSSQQPYTTSFFLERKGQTGILVFTMYSYYDAIHPRIKRRLFHLRCPQKYP